MKYDFDITRLRNLMKGKGFSVDDLSEKSGIKRTTLYNYLNNKTPITVEALVSIFNILNSDLSEVIKMYNISNERKKINEPNAPNYDIKKNDGKNDGVIDAKPNAPHYDINLEMNPFQLRTDTLLEHQKIPIYSIEAAAGIVTVFSDLNKHNVVDYMDVPKAPKCDGAIYASGDSMYELIKSGDLLGFKYISDIPDDIYWGQIYILAIDVGGEEMVTVKFVQKGSEKGYVKLVSQNKHHQDKEVHISKIRSMGLVKLTLRYNTMN